MVIGPAQLLERTSEIDAITTAVASAASGRGRVLLVEGPAGIGKTTLVAAAARAAETAGFTILHARGGTFERAHGFGVARQLFQRVADPALLDGPAAAAAGPLGLDGHGAGAGSGPFAALESLHWLVVGLAERGPLALLVDDVHWADAPSVRALGYVARRLDDLPVLLVVAFRAGTDGERVRAALAGLPYAEILTPPALSDEATAALVRRLAPEADDGVCAACHAATGGNPFYVREVAHALPGEDLQRGAAAADRLLGWSPERVTRVVTARLAALPDDARALARAVGVLGDRTPVGRAGVLAGLEPDAATRAADVLREAGILAAGPALEMVHPIVGTAVHEDLPAGERAAAHARAARLLATERAAAEHVGAHLVAAERTGDAWACERLVEAAAEALARGAPDATAVYLRRALDEPAPDRLRGSLLLQLGSAEALAFDGPAAAVHLREAFELATSTGERIRAALTLAAAGTHDARAGEDLDLLLRVREEVEAAGDEALTARLEGHILNVARFESDARRRAMPVARRLQERLDAGAPAAASVLASQAAELTMAARSAPAVVDLARRALGGDREAEPLVDVNTSLVAARCLLAADALDDVGRVLDAFLDEARARGTVLDLAFLVTFRAEHALRCGDVTMGEALARTAFTLGLEYDWPVGLPAATAHLLWALREQGRLQEAEAALGEAGLDGRDEELSSVYPTLLLLHARAGVRLAAGDPAAALADLDGCRRRLEDHGEDNPALVPWRSTAATALLAAGDPERARALAAEEVRVTRGFGAPCALGRALRVAGAVAGDARQAEALLREAVAVLEPSPGRLEHGHALAALGAALARGARDAEARTVLREALGLAHRCGAAALEQAVLDGLRAAGARPRRALLTGPGALTPRERSVCALAAAGRTNREIAEALFISVRTVEFHLSGAYPKLGIGSRRELAAALAAEGESDLAVVS